MAIELGTATLFALILLVINGGLQWIRELAKNKTLNENGNALGEIKSQISTVDSKVDCMDKKVGETKVKMAEIKAAVSAQEKQCKATVMRFDKAISDQGQHIVKLASRKQ